MGLDLNIVSTLFMVELPIWDINCMAPIFNWDKQFSVPVLSKHVSRKILHLTGFYVYYFLFVSLQLKLRLVCFRLLLWFCLQLQKKDPVTEIVIVKITVSYTGSLITSVTINQVTFIIHFNANQMVTKCVNF